MNTIEKLAVLNKTLNQYPALIEYCKIGLDVEDLCLDKLDDIYDESFDNGDNTLCAEIKEYKKDLQEFLDIYGDIDN